MRMPRSAPLQRHGCSQQLRIVTLSIRYHKSMCTLQGLCVQLRRARYSMNYRRSWSIEIECFCAHKPPSTRPIR